MTLVGGELDARDVVRRADGCGARLGDKAGGGRAKRDQFTGQRNLAERGPRVGDRVVGQHRKFARAGERGTQEMGLGAADQDVAEEWTRRGFFGQIGGGDGGGRREECGGGGREGCETELGERSLRFGGARRP